MPATEGIARRYAAAIGFAVVGELTRKPEWDGVASDPDIGLSGYCRVWVDEGGNAYYVHGKECAIIDPEGMVYGPPVNSQMYSINFFGKSSLFV